MNRYGIAAVLAAAAITLCACGAGTPQTRPTKTITVTASPTQPASQPATSQPAGGSQGTSASGCLSRYLNGSVGLTQGTAGATEIVIVFKNLNNVPCTLYGYPGVAQAAGTPVTDIGQPSSEDPSTPRELVTLAPGGYANATLQIEDAVNFPSSVCTQVPATWLAVIPPNQTIPLYVSYSSTACQGTAKLLSVTPVQPGNGG